MNRKPRQVPIFLYWRVENVQFWINSIGHLGWLSCILNFPRFHKNVNSLELWKYISENSSPKGSFWRNKRKSEISSLSADSRYLLAVALNTSRNNELKLNYCLLFAKYYLYYQKMYYKACNSTEFVLKLEQKLLIESRLKRKLFVWKCFCLTSFKWSCFFL